MELFFFLVPLVLTSTIVAANEAIILTAIPKYAGFPDTHHIFMIPGTPYDLTKNETLYQYAVSYSSQPYARFQSCAVDYSRKVLYMYDKRYSEIVAISNLDTENGFDNSAITKLHVGVSRGDVKVAVDWVSHNIYWTDPMFRLIVMQPADADVTNSNLYKIIVKENLDRPYALAVDPVGGFIFWSDIYVYPKIERASLSGENRKAIISTGLLLPTAIDVDISDVFNRRIYWVDMNRDTIETADLEGGDRRIVKRISHTQFYDIAVFRDVLSVVNIDSKYRSVHFVNKTSGNIVANPYTRQQETLYGICIFSAEVQLVMQDHCASANCSDMCVSEGGKASCLCRDGFKLTDGFLCIEDTGMYHRGIVFSDDQGIYVADIRILTVELSTYNYKTIYSSNFGEIQFMTVDAVDRSVIFSTANGTIYSLKIDASNPEPRHVVSSVDSTDMITGLSLDWRDKNIYWTAGASKGSISVVSRVTGDVFTLVTELNNPRGIKLLALEMKIAWISGTGFNKSIEVSNMDGTGRKTILGGAQLTDPKSLDFDSQTNRMYWIDSGNIKSIKLDGTELNILPVSARLPDLLLIYKDYLVWTEDKSIYTASLQQPLINVISDSFDNINKITALRVLDEVTQPHQKGPCNDANGGCEHICIPVGLNRICECEYGFTKESDGRSCSSEPMTDNVLLVTDWSHNKIYQISLNTDDVRALDIQITGNPNAVIYNPFSERVIWGDTKDEKIRSVYLNGSSQNVLVNNGAYGAFADRFAVDLSSGNVFFTSVNLTADGFVGVGVISPRGDVLHLVTGGHRPRDIVVDPSEGLMFWTEHGNDPSVKKSNIDGSGVSVIVSENIYWPNGIAIDYTDKLLFISDGYYNTIQSCNYTGVCAVIHTDPGAHLMDVELSDVYLYYTAWNRPYITKINRIYTSDVSSLAGNAHLGRLDSISVYRSTAQQPENEHCASNQGLGECSTFCLPSKVGYRCACQNGVSLGIDNKICEDVGMCPRDLLHISISYSCTYLHRTECSYTCSKFYIPATDDNKIKCLYGEWSVRVPCVFSTATCPEEVTDVLFNRACTYQNGRNCTYRCPHNHEPTSEGGVMACDNGVWDNPDPCREKVPHCPVDVANVRFYQTCTYQNDEVCNFFCQNGLEPVPIDSSMMCINGSWEFERPCTAPSTATIAPSPTTSAYSSSSAKTSTESDTSAPGEHGADVVPIAVGVSIGIVILAIIIVAVLVFIFKRRNRRQETPPFREFHSPLYEGLDNSSAGSTVSSRLDGNQRPDTTYDLINFDEPGSSETDSRDYSNAGKQFPSETAVEYKTFGGSIASEPSVYLHPASKQSDYLHPVSKRNDYLHPASKRRDVENFM